MKYPRIPYPGAKGKLAPFLVEMMPNKGRYYVEPFVGRGNVFFAAALNLNFKSWHINDIKTSNFFNALVNTKGRITIPERTREEYLKQKKLYRKSDNNKAILLEPYLTFSGGGYEKAGFGGKRSANAKSYKKTLLESAKIIISKKTKVTALDWKNINLNKLIFDDFVFLDPPYFGADVRAYSNNFDHTNMIKILKNAKFKWMLTEYEQKFYIKAFGKPCYKKVVQLACDGLGNRKRIECVWKNY